uniref:Guanylate cyclase domain-containing protein n=1 Tax=Macrostomum lignano TaxID=282301 RepID=A0A1I8ITN2_9PLAT
LGPRSPQSRRGASQSAGRPMRIRCLGVSSSSAMISGIVLPNSSKLLNSLRLSCSSALSLLSARERRSAIFEPSLSSLSSSLSCGYCCPFCFSRLPQQPPSAAPQSHQSRDVRRCPTGASEKVQPMRLGGSSLRQRLGDLSLRLAAVYRLSLWLVAVYRLSLRLVAAYRLSLQLAAVYACHSDWLLLTACHSSWLLLTALSLRLAAAYRLSLQLAAVYRLSLQLAAVYRLSLPAGCCLPPVTPAAAAATACHSGWLLFTACHSGWLLFTACHSLAAVTACHSGWLLLTACHSSWLLLIACHFGRIAADKLVQHGLHRIPVWIFSSQHRLFLCRRGGWPGAHSSIRRLHAEKLAQNQPSNRESGGAVTKESSVLLSGIKAGERSRGGPAAREHIRPPGAGIAMPHPLRSASRPLLSPASIEQFLRTQAIQQYSMVKTLSCLSCCLVAVALTTIAGAEDAGCNQCEPGAICVDLEARWVERRKANIQEILVPNAHELIAQHSSRCRELSHVIVRGSLAEFAASRRGGSLQISTGPLHSLSPAGGRHADGSSMAMVSSGHALSGGHALNVGQAHQVRCDNSRRGVGRPLPGRRSGAVVVQDIDYSGAGVSMTCALCSVTHAFASVSALGSAPHVDIVMPSTTRARLLYTSCWRRCRPVGTP